MNNRKPPPPGEDSGGSRDEDLELWRGVVRDVKPLPGRRAPPPVKTKTVASASGATKETTSRTTPRPAGTPATPSPANPAMPGVDKRSAQRLRRGQLDIEARLDLHGVTQREAHSQLCAFLARAQDASKRCVLVITGKGLHGDESGVLRQMVPQWIEQPPLRQRVLAVTSAHARDGGGGAYYVLLRRKRTARD